MKSDDLKIVLAASNADKTKLHKLLELFNKLPAELQAIASSVIRAQLRTKQ